MLDLTSARTPAAWMLEVKYLRTEAKKPEIERAIAQAHAQLKRYTSDEHLVVLLTHGRALRAGALVFVGAKDVLFRPFGKEQVPAKPPRRRPRKRPAASR